MKLFNLVAGALALNTLDLACATPVNNQAEEQPAKRHLPSNANSKHLRYERSFENVKRQEQVISPDTSQEGYYREGGFSDGNPISSDGKGAPLSGVYIQRSAL
jgi:hypothetical protein